MARTKLTVTQSWQNFNGPALITVEKTGDGVLLLNSEESDDTALAVRSSDGTRAQIDQRAHDTTYYRATGDGWQIITDNGL